MTLRPDGAHRSTYRAASGERVARLILAGAGFDRGGCYRQGPTTAP